ncbi:MAG: DUF1501 domain-containing protein, partial [Planctomycetota bacterium]|nr:DUF1501 domain-containing protein [Planctomycetota bacterium]
FQTSRRNLLQAGAIGMLGPSLTNMANAEIPTGVASKTKSVIFLFLTGGISHQDTFDMKPLAPLDVRGEFHPIHTATPGIEISEHLPLIAKRTNDLALLRSVTTNSSGHGPACHMLLTGRLDIPPGLKTPPDPNEWPSIPSQLTYALRGNTPLPPAAVLPQPSINEAAQVRPGQYAGKLGALWESWHIDIASKCPLGNGACPDCFRFDLDEFEHVPATIFDTPMLTLPEGGGSRFNRRINLLDEIESQQTRLARNAESGRLDRNRLQAISVLGDPKTSRAFDVEHADPKTLERYGKNKFGLSMLMAYRLVDAGVRFVQVNVGKNSTWDTHRRNFVNLKNNLLPPLDRAYTALLDDLKDSGLLDDTLVLLSGEFGRTPKINNNAGRDHWGPVMTSVFTGGGVQGGQVVGATDKLAAYPVEGKLSVENLSATMFSALGVPRHAEWRDIDGRPHEMYRAEPVTEIF